VGGRAAGGFSSREVQAGQHCAASGEERAEDRSVVHPKRAVPVGTRAQGQLREAALHQPGWQRSIPDLIQPLKPAAERLENGLPVARDQPCPTAELPRNQTRSSVHASRVSARTRRPPTHAREGERIARKPAVSGVARSRADRLSSVQAASWQVREETWTR
jgi:hypothetical protein